MPKTELVDDLGLSAFAIADSLRSISRSIRQCADRIESAAKDGSRETLQNALQLIFKTADTPGSKIVFAGVGKSYLIGRKLAATMTSVGTPAISIHATEALHGDLGIIRPFDCIILLSYSGATDEVVNLATILRNSNWPSSFQPSVLNSHVNSHTNEVASDSSRSDSFLHSGVFLLGMGAEMDSPLGRLCDAWIECKVDGELSSTVCAPTTSSSLMLAMGDSIAMLLMARRNFGPHDYARNHPGGELGRKSRSEIAYTTTC
ncbi:hypothetical protein GGI25_001396 [Coemansia spiralis]|uniref:SIS domain-containing protein n=2 Tax=Coemansia TaxID=4863 RepID=A0A9W8G606_9FUNG|nr:hypothetical protein BX070DRAFT_71201 [Coemansia spiralis]KAJ1994739.1 hypothetical protein EDC05_001361 [Coemansia umbellata]KAJ2624559.1 hypothetical protein GGI26_001478 [Coemansia sp. RSA 1358]KAJ2679473.1 hypothetical protein GGI25_001396 [Coemansia spiralis]